MGGQFWWDIAMAFIMNKSGYLSRTLYYITIDFISMA